MNQPNNLTYDLLKDANLTQTIERGFEECHPLQFVRELLQNSIEAGATKVRVRYETEAKGVKGIDRAIFVDNGKGMADPDLMKRYAQFNSSGKIVGTMHDNFGIGAKISLLPFNQYGLVFMSWDKENLDGNMIWLCKNTKGQYGAKRFPVAVYEGDDLEPSYYEHESCIAPVECMEEGIDWNQILINCKRLVSSKHGTAVILLGNHSMDSTGHYTGYESKDGAFYSWNKFASHRFCVLPISLSFSPSPQDSKKHKFTNIRQNHYESDGLIGNYKGLIERTYSLAFPNGRISIYLKNPRNTRSRGLSQSFTFGFLYKNEVYYTSSGNQYAGSWGVGASREIAKRLTILVEFNPYKGDSPGVIPSQSRSDLIWKNPKSPSSEQEAFKQTFKYQMDEVRRYVRDHLPEELIELIRDHTPKTNSVKAEDVLKEYGDLFKPRRITRKKGKSIEVLVKNKDGEMYMDCVSFGGQSRLPLGSQGTISPTGQGTPHSPECVGDDNPNGETPAVQRIRRRKTKPVNPSVSWSDDLEFFKDDSRHVRFAFYSGGVEPSLMLNQEWHILKDYENKILGEYNRKQDESAIKGVIKTEVEKAALGVVLHILGSKKHGYSTEPEDIQRAVTMSFLGGHQTLTTIRHALSKKTGIKKK